MDNQEATHAQLDIINESYLTAMGFTVARVEFSITKL